MLFSWCESCDKEHKHKFNVTNYVYTQVGLKMMKIMNLYEFKIFNKNEKML